VWAKNPDVAVGIVVIGGLQLADMYSRHVPALDRLRAAVPGDIVCRQELLDGEIMVGALAVMGGVLVGVSTRSVGASLAFVAVVAAMSYWHHAVLDSPQV
jgi:hypothetical protein